MRITSIKKAKRALFDIFADDELVCTLDEIDVERLKLAEGDEIDPDELLEIARNGSARRDAIKLLTYKRYSSGDLYKKLKIKGHGSAEIEQAIDYYKKKGYIDDLDYARRYVADAVRLRKEGAFRIRMALLERGADENDIENILLEYVDEQMGNLKILVEKGVLNTDIEKLKRKLVYKGYSFTDINNAISENCNIAQKYM